jgi:lysozyme
MTTEDLIKRNEAAGGPKLRMYLDTAKPPRWTIGWGHNLSDRSISVRACQVIFEDDLHEAQVTLNRVLPWTASLDDARRAVFVDLIFNMGPSKLLTFKNTLAAAERRDWPAAAAGLRASLYAKQVGNRAERNAKQWETGVWQT